MKYYAIGTKSGKQQDGASVVISNLSESRVSAVNEAERIARKEGITLQGVYVLGNGYKNDGIMTKGIRGQKRAAHAKQVKLAKRKKLLKTK